MKLTETSGLNHVHSDSAVALNAVSTNSTVSIATAYLPTEKEYREAAEKIALQFTARWSEPKYQCPKCGGGMCRDEMAVLCSNPPKRKYQCNKCGHVDYQYV